MQSPELQLKIERWRDAARRNELSLEDMREAIAALRASRGAVPTAVGGSKVTKAARATKAKPSGDDLLSELEGL